MKNKLRLSNILPILSDEVKSAIASLNLPEDTAAIRKRAAKPSEELIPGERAAIQYVSTRDIDRDGEIMVPEGCVLDQFRLAPQVLWGHNYSLPPVGSDEWIQADEYGVKAKTIYATTERGQEVWTLKKEGHLKTSSVGFIPMEYVMQDGPGWAEVVKKLTEKWGVKSTYFKDVWCIYTKWLLLEHSEVSVPANPNALTIDVAKQLGISGAMMKDLGIEEESEKGEPDTTPLTPLEPDLKLIQMTPILRSIELPQVTPVLTPIDINALVMERMEVARGRV